MDILQSVLFFLLSPMASSAIIKHDILTPKLDTFTFKEVCQKLGAKNLELIEEKSPTEIDCMGKVFPVIDFCLNQFLMDKTVTRGIIDGKTKTVKCERSTSVMVSLSCDKKDLTYCFDPKKGCSELRKLYANRLDLVHFSMLEKNINCYFARPLGESLNEVP